MPMDRESLPLALVGQFTDEVMNEQGVIIVAKLANAMDIPNAEFSKSLDFADGDDAGEAIQIRLRMLLATLNELANELGGKSNVVGFLKIEQPILNFERPIDMIRDGKLQSFCSKILDTLTSQPD